MAHTSHFLFTANANPVRISILSLKLARSILLQAISACFSLASNITTRPPTDNTLASHIVLYPPRVPISKILRAP